MIKYYTIYKITHKDSGKFYIGRHVTENLDDGYMGSGKLIKYAQEKYGLEAFEKEYIAVFYDPYFMFLYEQTIVTEEFCNRKDTYNIAPGGFAGGWSYINSNNLSNCFKGGETAGKMKTPKQTKARKNVMLQNRKQYYNFGNKSRTNLSHSDISREKISKGQSGSKNSQFGSIWITNGIENRKIKKAQKIPEGWVKGRKVYPSLV